MPTYNMYVVCDNMNVPILMIVYIRIYSYCIPGSCSQLVGREKRGEGGGREGRMVGGGRGEPGRREGRGGSPHVERGEESSTEVVENSTQV